MAVIAGLFVCAAALGLPEAVEHDHPTRNAAESSATTTTCR